MLHVCLAFRDEDGAYTAHAGAVLVSLLRNTSAPVTAHVLLDESLTPEGRACLAAVASHYGQGMAFYDVRRMGGGAEVHIPLWGRGSLYRLFIPQCLEVERVLYLDCDMCFTCDVAEVFAAVMEAPDAPLACVRDEGALVYPPARAYVKALGLDPDMYFNSGLLGWNIPAVRGLFSDFAATSLKLIQRLNTSQYKDQDALNYLFARLGVHYLDPRFNFVMHVSDRLLLTEEELAGKVIHYCAQKPWGPHAFPAMKLHRENYRILERLCTRSRSE